MGAEPRMRPTVLSPVAYMHTAGVLGSSFDAQLAGQPNHEQSCALSLRAAGPLRTGWAPEASQRSTGGAAVAVTFVG